jgi:hypothetical protein
MTLFRLNQREKGTSRIYCASSQLAKKNSFFKGIKIRTNFTIPLRAIVQTKSLVKGEPQGNFFETDMAPIVSERFVHFLALANIQNVQLFPVVLTSSDKSKTWNGFYALNILGLKSVSNMNAPGQKSELMLFRRAEDPTCVCVDNHFEKALQDERKATGSGRWYIDLFQSYDFIWFRNEHFKKMAKVCNTLHRYHDAIPAGKGYSQKQVREFLNLVNKLLLFRLHLPDTGGGRLKAKKLASAAEKFGELFSVHPPTKESWRLAQKISSFAFEIHIYMSAVCDIPEKGSSRP